MKRALFPALALSLAACGAIPLPAQNVNLDLNLPVPPLRDPSPAVIYLAADAFNGQTIPASITLSRLEMDALYSGAPGKRQFTLYLRSTAPEGCLQSGNFFVCPNAAGGAQVSQFTLTTDQTTRIRLQGGRGSALNTAAHTGKGYFGLSLTAGDQTGAADSLHLTKATAYPAL